MLIEMLIKCWLRCYLTCWFKCCLMIWWGRQRAAFNAEAVERTGEFAVFCQKTAPDIETVRCIDGFSNLSERLHLTLKRSDALTNFRIFCQRAASDIETVRCTDEFSDFACYRAVGLQIIDDWNDAGRQIDRRDVRNLLLTAKYVGWDLQDKTFSFSLSRLQM